MKRKILTDLVEEQPNRQLELPFVEYQGNTAIQYELPLKYPEEEELYRT
jgi:hypothetical protein